VLYRPSDKIKIAIDCSLLGMGYVNVKARTGIFRAFDQTLASLLDQQNIELKLVGLNDEASPWYRRSTQIYLQEKKLKFRGSTLASTNSFERFLDIPISVQKKALDYLSPVPLMRKMAVTMQFPFDRLFNSFSKAQVNLSQCQVYHSPYFPLPQELKEFPIARIITIYDLTPIYYPQLCSGRTIKQFHRILKSIDYCHDWVICISEATKQDFCAYTGINGNRVFVVPLAASGMFKPMSHSNESLSQSSHPLLSNKPYLLSLATLEPRKNLDFLITGFLRLLREQPNLDINLVLVGASGWKNQRIFEAISQFPDLQDHIIFTGFLPDQDLISICNGALGFVYPSLHEGFGLPPLEAMQCGIPVITSNTSSLPEVVGDAGIMIDPKDEDALCQAMLDIINNQTLRTELSRKGLERAKQFSWAKCAEQTVNVYRIAAKNLA
jgi:glycosyltransferase involved in cell wall biosynthesis